MRRNFLHRLFPAIAMLSFLPAAQAQTPGPELTAGYSLFHLRPSSGVDQEFKGFSLGFRHSFDANWSLEAAFNRQTGTESGSVSLRQLGFMAGPRYSRTFAPRWQAFAHALAGIQQLSAWQGPDSAKKNSLALAPGVGVDFALNRNVSLRAQEEIVFTRLAGKGQNNTAFYLGVVVRK